MKTATQLASLTAIAVLLLAGSAAAETIAITNFSFQTPDVGGGWTNEPDMPEWNTDAIGINYFLENTSSAFGGLNGTGYDGSQHLGIGGADTASDVAFVAQDTGTAWAANTVYSLTVGLGNRGGNWTEGPTFLGLSTDLTRENILGIERLVDPSELAGDGEWAEFTYTFTTDSTPPTGNINVLIGLAATATGQRAHIDNVRLETAPVPEPSTLLLFGLSLLGLAFYRRRASR